MKSMEICMIAPKGKGKSLSLFHLHMNEVMRQRLIYWNKKYNIICEGNGGELAQV